MIAQLDGNLFKIGFTTNQCEDRIRNTKDDPTFLLAPVHPVRTYDAIDLNTNKFENLMHRFFPEAQLDIEIMDRFGKLFRPPDLAALTAERRAALAMAPAWPSGS